MDGGGVGVGGGAEAEIEQMLRVNVRGPAVPAKTVSVTEMGPPVGAMVTVVSSALPLGAGITAPVKLIARTVELPADAMKPAAAVMPPEALEGVAPTTSNCQPEMSEAVSM